MTERRKASDFRDEEAAQLAQRRTIDFFDEHLRW